ncbi:hypothetical protein [Lysobacter sp. yr284]|uniref:hypothetical protein n=1 Tax=Lysobacter sp. yr284 TaxID=1761791 RepID=UPI000B86DD1F|nr:hypothetical protein [Lysobacter sp. yr284]
MSLLGLLVGSGPGVGGVVLGASLGSRALSVFGFWLAACGLQSWGCAALVARVFALVLPGLLDCGLLDVGLGVVFSGRRVVGAFARRALFGLVVSAVRVGFGGHLAPVLVFGFMGGGAVGFSSALFVWVLFVEALFGLDFRAAFVWVSLRVLMLVVLLLRSAVVVVALAVAAGLRMPLAKFLALRVVWALAGAVLVVGFVRAVVVDAAAEWWGRLLGWVLWFTLSELLGGLRTGSARRSMLVFFFAVYLALLIGLCVLSCSPTFGALLWVGVFVSGPDGVAALCVVVLVGALGDLAGVAAVLLRAWGVLSSW